MSKEIHETVTKLLKRNGKSKKELADFLNLHQGSISRVLKNEAITIDKLKSIASFLEIDLFDLLFQIYPPENKKVPYSVNNNTAHIIGEPEYKDLQCILFEIKEHLNEINKKISSFEKNLSDPS